MRNFKIKIYFKKDTLIQPRITLVKNDYNSTEFDFEFDIQDGKKVFELKKPDGTVWLKNIVDNKIVLVDHDENKNVISVINQAGKYNFEVVCYDENSKITAVQKGNFSVRDEIVDLDEDKLSEDVRVPLLDSLINETIEASKESKEQGDYAKEQGDYAKEQAQKVIDSNSEATKIIDNFESNVDTYTSDFNKNADSKLKLYNQNDTAKTNSYNENASSKLKEYNDNHEEKITDYNTNHTNKLKTYDNNDIEKVEAYNSNHDSKLSDYNTNAEAKLSEYNSNHEEKMQEYNENATTKVNEFNEEIETLKDELNDCYNNLLIGKAKGTSIHIKDGADARIRVLEIDGALEQETTEGKQLFDYQDIDLKEPASAISVDDEGWITITFANSSETDIKYANYWTKKSELLKINSQYNLFFEVKNVTGNGRLVVVSSATGHTGQFLTSVGYNFVDLAENNIYKNVIMARDSFEQTTSMLRSFVEFKPGQSGSITFRISVLEDITITPSDFVYEKFTGGRTSPGSEYPSEIEVLEGNVEGKVVNKNYFDYNYPTITRRGVTFEYDENTNEVIINGTPENNYISWFTNHIDLSKILENGKTYTLSNSKYGTGIYAQIMQKSKSTGTITNIHTRDTSRIITIDFENYDYTINIMTGTVETVGTLSNFRIKFQLENGNKATEIIPHQEEKVDVDLKGNFLAKLTDDIKDTLRIENGHAILHKKVDKERLISNNILSFVNEYKRFSWVNINSSKSIGSEYVKSNFAICKTNTTVNAEYKNTIIPRGRENGGHIIYVWLDNVTNIDEAKEFLDNNEMYVYYILKEPYDVDLELVKLPKTFKGVSNIFLNANLETNMHVDYVKDTQLVIDDLQSQIDNINTLLSTTSTSALLLDNLQSDLEGEVI